MLKIPIEAFIEGSTVIDDYAPLTAPADFTVVKMDFAEHDKKRNATSMDACSEVVCWKLKTCYEPVKNLMKQILNQMILSGESITLAEAAI